MAEPAARVVALVSGRGSNLQALLDTDPGWLGGRLVGVAANVADAAGLARAAAAGVPARVVEHGRFAERAAFDRALLAAIDTWHPDLVVLAGFMRILTPAFVASLGGRLINIHPSLLPALPGLHTHARAISEGHAEHGATVHFVTGELDGGPGIVRARVPVLAGDDADTLAARVLAREHHILPLATRWFCTGRLALRDDAAWLDGRRLDAPVDADAVDERPPGD